MRAVPRTVTAQRSGSMWMVCARQSDGLLADDGGGGVAGGQCAAEL
jgi:hypothetical protein